MIAHVIQSITELVFVLTMVEMMPVGIKIARQRRAKIFYVAFQ